MAFKADCWKYKVSNGLYQNGALGIYHLGNWELLVRWQDAAQATKFEKVVEKYKHFGLGSNKLVGLCLAELSRQKTAVWKLARWLGKSQTALKSWKKIQSYFQKAKESYVRQIKPGLNGHILGTYWAGGWILKVVWKTQKSAANFKKKLRRCSWQRMSDLDKGGAILVLAKSIRHKKFQIFKPGQGNRAVKKRAWRYEYNCKKF